MYQVVVNGEIIVVCSSPSWAQEIAEKLGGKVVSK